MSSLVDIFVRPRKAVADLAAEPRWVAAFLVLSVATALLFVVEYDSWCRETIHRLPSTASVDDRSTAYGWLQKEFWRNLPVVPARVLVGEGAFAYVLLLLASSLVKGKHLLYRHFLALEFHAALILLLPSLTQLFGFPLPSLALLVGEANVTLVTRSLLTATNIFTLWYLLVLAAGIGVLTHLRIRTAFLVAGGLWACTRFLTLGILTLLVRVFHLNV